jgi:hypothetical protein
MLSIEITPSNIACPRIRCAHSGQEIKDASEANVVWLEQTDERGVCRAVSPPRAVLKAWGRKEVTNTLLGCNRELRQRVCWMPLDACFVHLMRNTGFDQEKAVATVEHLSRL